MTVPIYSRLKQGVRKSRLRVVAVIVAVAAVPLGVGLIPHAVRAYRERAFFGKLAQARFPMNPPFFARQLLLEARELGLDLFQHYRQQARSSHVQLTLAQLLVVQESQLYLDHVTANFATVPPSEVRAWCAMLNEDPSVLSVRYEEGLSSLIRRSEGPHARFFLAQRHEALGEVREAQAIYAELLRTRNSLTLHAAKKLVDYPEYRQRALDTCLGLLDAGERRAVEGAALLITAALGWNELTERVGECIVSKNPTQLRQVVAEIKRRYASRKGRESAGCTTTDHASTCP